MGKIVSQILIFFLLISCASKNTQVKNFTNTINNEDSLNEQLEKLTNQIIANLQKQNKTKIAVINFSDLSGNNTYFGKYISEELLTRLFITGKFTVIERNLLNKIIKEQDLGISGYIDDNTAVSLGKILGVGAIATGTVIDMNLSIKINARLINTETGEVFAVASVEILKDNKVIGIIEEFEKLEIKARDIVAEQAKKAKQEEEQAFTNAKTINTISSFQLFLNNYPKSIFSQSVLILINNIKDKQAFDTAKSKNTIKAYELYLKDFINGKFTLTAQKSIEIINTQKFEKIQKEKTDYDVAKSKNTINSYQNYLTEYPQGKYRYKVKKKIKSLKEIQVFDKAKSEDSIFSFEKYLSLYPQGSFVNQAKEKIYTLKDYQLFQKAKSENTKESYQNYLNKFPQGKYVSEAEEGLNKKKKKMTFDDLMKELVSPIK